MSAQGNVWRVRKGSELVEGMRLRFGNVTMRLEGFEEMDGWTRVLTERNGFRLDPRQSYRVLVSAATGEPITE